MPIYEYECSHCHFHFERMQRFDEDPVSICPQCQGKVQRIIHSAPVFFKGSGFYSTDHGRGWLGSRSNEKEEHAEKEPAEKVGEDTAPKDTL